MTIPAHPYGSAVEWRIAVSRRFNDSVAASVYEEQVLPIIATHGIVLECSFASDETADVEFWTSRMKKILGCADLHILLDIHRSESMDFEFRISDSCANIYGGKRVALYSEFGDVWDLPGFLPIQIRITEDEGETTFRRVRRYVEVHARPRELLGVRLHEALRWAKKKRTRELKAARFFCERTATWLNKMITGLQMPSVIAVHMEMTAVARKLAARTSMIEAHREPFLLRIAGRALLESLDGSQEDCESRLKLTDGLLRYMSQKDNDNGAPFVANEEGADPLTRFSNLMEQFEINVRKGSIPLPKRFWEAYTFIRDERARFWAATIGTDPSNWFRRLNLSAVITAFLTIRLRRASRRVVSQREF